MCVADSSILNRAEPTGPKMSQWNSEQLFSPGKKWEYTYILYILFLLKSSVIAVTCFLHLRTETVLPSAEVIHKYIYFRIQRFQVVPQKSVGCLMLVCMVYLTSALLCCCKHCFKERYIFCGCCKMLLHTQINSVANLQSRRKKLSKVVAQFAHP